MPFKARDHTHNKTQAVNLSISISNVW